MLSIVRGFLGGSCLYVPNVPITFLTDSCQNPPALSFAELDGLVRFSFGRIELRDQKNCGSEDTLTEVRDLSKGNTFG